MPEAAQCAAAPSCACGFTFSVVVTLSDITSLPNLSGLVVNR